LAGLDDRTATDGMTAGQRLLLPWALATTVASAYGVTDLAETGVVQGGLDHLRLAVLRFGGSIDAAAVCGDDLIVMPRGVDGMIRGEQWTESTSDG